MAGTARPFCSWLRTFTSPLNSLHAGSSKVDEVFPGEGPGVYPQGIVQIGWKFDAQCLCRPDVLSGFVILQTTGLTDRPPMLSVRGKNQAAQVHARRVREASFEICSCGHSSSVKTIFLWLTPSDDVAAIGPKGFKSWCMCAFHPCHGGGRSKPQDQVSVLALLSLQLRKVPMTPSAPFRLSVLPFLLCS